MIYHPDEGPILHHFVRPEHLIELLERRALHLIRQDKQSDPGDGVLPTACFDQPFQGPLEQSLGLNASFLRSQATAIAAHRARTFIMSWTLTPSESVRTIYGEHGRRCELRISTLNLKRLIGYEWLQGNEFPPKRRPVAEIGGAITTAQLKEVIYTDGRSAIRVVPSYFATAHKDEKQYAEENEVRVEAVIPLENGAVNTDDTLIRWKVTLFDGLRITLTDQIPPAAAARISGLAAELKIPVG
jgi:hypothetical protein